jgi:hypothetical protein
VKNTDSGGPHVVMRKIIERIVGLCTPDTVLLHTWLLHAQVRMLLESFVARVRIFYFISASALHSNENSLTK